MRYRFIDEVVALDLGERPRIETRKTFAPGDDAFSGPHGADRVPDSLLLECLAMAGGYLILRRLGASRLPLLLKVPECRFEGAGRAGVALRAVTELGAWSAVSAPAVLVEAAGEVFSGPTRVLAARLLYACLEVPGLGPAVAAALEAERR